MVIVSSSLLSRRDKGGGSGDATVKVMKVRAMEMKAMGAKAVMTLMTK